MFPAGWPSSSVKAKNVKALGFCVLNYTSAISGCPGYNYLPDMLLFGWVGCIIKFSSSRRPEAQKA